MSYISCSNTGASGLLSKFLLLRSAEPTDGSASNPPWVLAVATTEPASEGSNFNIIGVGPEGCGAVIDRSARHRSDPVSTQTPLL
eukprot:3331153-Pyramimonas_sp.AAC.1